MISAQLAENGGIVVEDQRTKQQYTLKRGSNRLPSGKYELTVTTPAGLVLDTPKFQIRRGGTVIATVTAQAVATSKANRQAGTSGSGRTSPDLLTSDWQWTEPEKLGPAVNSGSGDFLPSLSADELTMIFASWRSGGHGKVDLWQTTREAVDKPWQKAEKLGPLINTWDVESAPDLSADGLTLLFDSPKEHPDAIGKDDLWFCTRQTAEDVWSEPQPMGRGVNSAHRDWNGSLSQDGLTLFFASDRPGSLGDMDLWMATRPALDQPFRAPQSLGPAINSPARESAPRISADGRTLFFPSDRPGSIGKTDLWMSVRSDMKADWPAATNLGPTINRRGQRVFGLWLSADGQTMLLDRSEAETRSIWQTRRNPKSQIASPLADRDFALEFPADGTGRVVIPTLTWDGTPSLTIEARVSTTFPRPSPMIIARVQGSAYAQLYCFGASSSKKARWAGLAGIGLDNYSAIMAAEISPEITGQVTHVAVVINASAVRIFENGKLLSEKPHSVSQFSGKRSSGTSLGAEFDEKTKRWVYGFQGRLDEVRISKIPRYSQNFTPEVRFNPDADTLALYHCDEGHGETLTDASGNKHHGKIVGAKWIPTREYAGDVVATLEPATPVVRSLTPSELLASPDYEWSPLEAVPGLSSLGTELGPCLAADGLSLWFHSHQDRPEKTGRLILWQAWRHELNQPFVKPVPVEDSVNELPGANLTDATLSANGLLMAFCRSNTKDGSGADVWLSSRPSGDASWSAPVSAGVAVNSPALEWEPELSPDGLELFFHSDRANDHGGTDLWISRRSSRDEQFGMPQNLGAEINRLDHEGGATLSFDGLTLVFHCVSSTSGNESSLWQTSRRAVGEPFESPRPLLVPGLSGQRATSPSLSSAADQLFVSTSNRSASIAVSRRLPKRNAPSM